LVLYSTLLVLLFLKQNKLQAELSKFNGSETDSLYPIIFVIFNFSMLNQKLEEYQFIQSNYYKNNNFQIIVFLYKLLIQK